jgi:LmbE family N-acetylglucosaminyl deacetylase
MNRISRRTLLAGGTLAAGSLALSTAFAAGQSPNDSNKKRPLKIVVTGGHPGDPEYGCGGTIARYAAAGHDVVLIYLNQGEPIGTPAAKKGLRVAEAKRACEILGARPLFAGQIDGAAIVDPAHYDGFRKLIQTEQPDLLITHWPIDNHTDHRAISNLAYDAWLHSGKAAAFYYYEVSTGEDTCQFSPTDYVDISNYLDKKHAACMAHATQAPEKYYPLQQSVTRFRGVESGYKEAEAFVRHVNSRDFLAKVLVAP